MHSNMVVKYCIFFNEKNYLNNECPPNSKSLGSMKFLVTHTVITNYAIHMHSVWKYDLFCLYLGRKYDQPKFSGLR